MLNLRRSLRLGQQDDENFAPDMAPPPDEGRFPSPQTAGNSWEAEKANLLEQMHKWYEDEARKVKMTTVHQIAEALEMRLSEIERALDNQRQPNIEMALHRVIEIKQYLEKLKAPLIETAPTMENLGLSTPNDE